MKRKTTRKRLPELNTLPLYIRARLVLQTSSWYHRRSGDRGPMKALGFVKSTDAATTGAATNETGKPKSNTDFKAMSRYRSAGPD